MDSSDWAGVYAGSVVLLALAVPLLALVAAVLLWGFERVWAPVQRLLCRLLACDERVSDDWPFLRGRTPLHSHMASVAYVVASAAFVTGLGMAVFMAILLAKESLSSLGPP